MLNKLLLFRQTSTHGEVVPERPSPGGLQVSLFPRVGLDSVEHDAGEPWPRGRPHPAHLRDVQLRRHSPQDQRRAGYELWVVRERVLFPWVGHFSVSLSKTSFSSAKLHWNTTFILSSLLLFFSPISLTTFLVPLITQTPVRTSLLWPTYSILGLDLDTRLLRTSHGNATRSGSPRTAWSAQDPFAAPGSFVRNMLICVRAVLKHSKIVWDRSGTWKGAHFTASTDNSRHGKRGEIRLKIHNFTSLNFLKLFNRHFFLGRWSAQDPGAGQLLHVLLDVACRASVPTFSLFDWHNWKIRCQNLVKAYSQQPI